MRHERSEKLVTPQIVQKAGFGGSMIDAKAFLLSIILSPSSLKNNQRYNISCLNHFDKVIRNSVKTNVLLFLWAFQGWKENPWSPVMPTMLPGTIWNQRLSVQHFFLFPETVSWLHINLYFFKNEGGFQQYTK